MDENELTPDDKKLEEKEEEETTIQSDDNGDDNDDDSEYEDAVDKDIDLEGSIREVTTSVHLFFNNKYDEARKVLEARSDSSIYHALALSLLDFLNAVFTFEEEHIKKASITIQKYLKLCNVYKHKNITITNKISSAIGNVNYNEYTPLEVHAELCYAEGLLLKSFLLLIEDESLINLIKSCIKVKNSFNSFKKCETILSDYNWQNDYLKDNFLVGVKAGIGSFNLLISTLPKKIVKLLEFIGFSGKKELGLRELKIGNEYYGLGRQLTNCLTLLSYNLILTYVVSDNEGDLEFCDKALTKQFEYYPNGVIFLMYKGRLEFMKGNIEEGEKWYLKSLHSQDRWLQFHHICYWELMWINVCKQDYKSACEYVDQLLQNSKWSRTMFSYLKACILLIDKGDQNQIDELMKDVPIYKKKMAGKSIPTEKFVIKKSQRYWKQKKRLCVPILEMLYVYNYFKPLSKDIIAIENVFKIVEKELESITGDENELDNKALLWLLKGTCLRYMKSPYQAEVCLKQVTKNEKKISADNDYFVPYAWVELGLLELDRGDYKKAALYLDHVKNNYSGYSLETKLHFKIHTSEIRMAELKNQKK